MSLRQLFYRNYDVARRLIVPRLRNSQYEYREALDQSVRRGMRWLDLGCGHQLLPSWMPDAAQAEVEILGRASAVGIDLDRHNLQRHCGLSLKLLGNAVELPFADQTFDLVTANMVVEHLAVPGAALREIRRVLRPGGRFVFHTPNALHYYSIAARLTPSFMKGLLLRILQGRKDEDTFATFYRLNTFGAISRVATEAGFRLVELQLVSSTAATVMLGPAVVLELLLIRLLETRLLRSFRTDLIAVLERAETNDPPLVGQAPATARSGVRCPDLRVERLG